MKSIKFGANDRYEAVIYAKKEMNKKSVRALVDAGFNARSGHIEQRYLILNADIDDLNPNKNPYFNSKIQDKETDAHFIIVYENGVPIGRSIALYDPLYNEYHLKYNRKPVVWLGWPEFKNVEVGKMLLELTLDEAKSFKKKDSSIQCLIGPGRPNEQGIVGLRIAGQFIYFMEPDNPLWYEEVFESIEVDDYWTAFHFNEEDIKQWQRVIDASRMLFSRSKSSDVEVVQINKFTLAKYLSGIYDVYRDAWDSEEHVHGRALTKKEFDYMAKGLKMLIPPQWNNVYLALDKHTRKTIGISISLPNFNEALEKINARTSGERMRKEIAFFLKNFLGIARYRSGRIFIAGVLPEISGLKRSAISSMLISNAIENFRRNGINEMTMSQLAVPNRDVVAPLMVAYGVDKKLISNDEYRKNAVKIIRELSKKGKASLAAVYRIPV
jgi:hypothetical protein